ncbi:quinolinate synthase NadA [Saccharicrinis fermentans]|uniref:Quinolinate synthase n=1 Tax=Saccharicrinis fermentans DSM 9555 = JCM 21142 TaxID=869213 RepID=W7YBJ1_9BACT|nr:quinolinate synthase NadA [Saccharicrinis fermentans]GAF01801.1 quinolinate synthase A [Saccharicrinis fermentans DSM 9555 = JCM 21142]
MELKENWLKKGFVDESTKEVGNIEDAFLKLKKEKNAVLMAHFYQENKIQDIADFVGDSLALAQFAAKTDAEIIMVAGVHFMGESAKILSPEKTVIVPDLNAGCSLADSCPPDVFAKFIKQYPDHKVITYVNTSAEIKALSDIVVTSTNAKAIVDSFPKDEKLIFGPDKNLGNYINSITGREMLLWDGACHVHEKFSLEKILEIKDSNKDAEILAHPECKKQLLMVADHIGSTAALLNYSSTSSSQKFIVATESGIIHQMKLKSPNKTFIPAPPNDSTCACNDCEFMRLNTMDKLYNALKFGWPTIEVDEAVRVKAVKPIERMLDISNKLGL